MSQPGPKRINLWMPLLFSIILIVGMFVGYRLRDSGSFKRSISSIIQSEDRLEEMISLINNRYVDPVEEEDLYQNGINGILKTLDPHSYYINSADVAETNESLNGNYKGLGIEFNIYNDTLTVISMVKGGPAEASHLQIGDQIIELEGENIAGLGLTNDLIKSKLKNIPTDTIRLSVKRNAEDQILDLQLMRSSVPFYSLDAHYMISNQIGYIRINRFSATTYEEFHKALLQLKGSGMTKLLLDLRQNPGGFVDAAIGILDEFFAKDKLMLTVNGKTFEKNEYLSTGKGDFENGEVVVMVDESSASASEIIAGALQDWDRGVVIGRRTFGKGLVQEQFEMNDGSALRLTVARYYTPTGRSIQRDYLAKYPSANEEEETTINTMLSGNYSTIPDEEANKYYTLQEQRTIYGGGGVKPDVFVPYKSYLLSADLWHVVNGVNDFVNEYFTANINTLATYKTVSEFNKNFHVSDVALSKFKQEALIKFPASANSVWKNKDQINYLKVLIKASIARLLFRNDGYYYVLNTQDPLVQEAILLLETNKYNQILKINK